ncbi:DUF1858 domain-containing protein [Thermospira aquatica]|uniref:DUF1858 domain-containing protein n=1 Tax=Thermospira aquatica TaxID=2828656 RepID=A0AAX3BGK6_9SPIR|nr:DUF1858 domain-containing protein [Thermospira aquatica]URA11213.1 DUF1858 domain-containing protein [Thermospira aquatica]
MEKKLITADDTIFDIVSRYPEVKKRLLELSPRYENLNNPVIFNTVARLTTVRKAAAVGNIYLREMLYQLNDAIGLGEAYLEEEKRATAGLSLGFPMPESPQEKPSWWEKRQQFTLLDVREKPHPFQEITTAAEKLQPGEGLLVFQGFVPYPLIEYLKTKGFEIFYETEKAQVTIGIYKKEA